jgi:TM2 domain-containing membrane protein YozV
MESRSCPNCGAQANSDKCEFCGTQVAQSVPQSVPQNTVQPFSGSAQVPQGDVSSRDWTTTLILSIFLGALGVDRFYVGKTGTGVVKLLVSICSLGFLAWVWWLVDIIFIATGKFTDDQGKVVKQK